MRKKYKNELFQFLLSTKFGIDQFEIKEKQDYFKLESDFVVLKDTPFHFIIRNSNEDFEAFDCLYVNYAPGFPMSEILPSQDYFGFDSVLSQLKYWLESKVSAYLEDQEEPDLWEEFKNGNKTLNINNIDFDDQTIFNIDEKKQIELSLNELKLLIKNNLETTEEEQDLINARLDYLIDASKRLNKFDWKSLAISSLVSISVTLSLDTQKGHLLFELFKKVFSIIPMLLN